MSSSLFNFAAAILMLSLVPGCKDDDPSTSSGTGGGNGGSATAGGGSGGSATASGGSGGGTTQPVAPAVVATIPSDGAVEVALDKSISAVFSETMDPATLTEKTFTLSSGAMSVQGTVVYANATAVFWPAVQLTSNSMYTATITTGAESSFGLGLKENYAWSFTTGNTVAPGLPVDLGTAGDYVILAKAAISTVPPSVITGNVAISPAAATYITGFSLTADATNVFSTSSQVTGNVFSADYAAPTPSDLTTAVGDMELAFTNAAARTPDVTELGAGNIGGMTLGPGVYKWGTSLLIPTDITLQGSATDVWIFQIAQTLTVSNATNIVLDGGALPKNVFWQVSGFVDLGQTSIALHTGASINGRLLAQTAVTLDSSTVVEPAK
jgi:hypothetical protein